MGAAILPLEPADKKRGRLAQRFGKVLPILVTPDSFPQSSLTAMPFFNKLSTINNELYEFRLKQSR